MGNGNLQVSFVTFALFAVAHSLINKDTPLATKTSSGGFLSARALSGSIPVFYSIINIPKLEY